MSDPTTIERFAADHQNALGPPYPGWDELDEPTRRHRVEAVMVALAHMPDVFLYQIPGNGRCRQDLTDAKASLFEEQRFTDQRRFVDQE